MRHVTSEVKIFNFVNLQPVASHRSSPERYSPFSKQHGYGLHYITLHPVTAGYKTYNAIHKALIYTVILRTYFLVSIPVHFGSLKVVILFCYYFFIITATVFPSVVRQMPGYTSQRRGTVRTLPN